MGQWTELVFVEGHEGQYLAVIEAECCPPEQSCQLIRQTGTGKGDAVRLGFAQATVIC